MKVLYVSGMGIPLQDILEGKSESQVTHSPGFFYPWYKMVQRGHQVDFVVTSNFNKKPVISVDWFRESNLIQNLYEPVSNAPWYSRIYRRLKRLILLAYYINKALSTDKYDFVYCWAFYEGVIGNILANLHGIPSGMRCMGTMLLPELKSQGKWLTAFKRPAEYLAFNLKKSFFLMTNDGTQGDLVYEIMSSSSKKYEFLFWKTGVKFSVYEELKPTMRLPPHRYLFYAARIEEWKGQDRVLEILNLLHINDHKLHLYFAGKTQSEKFLQALRQKIESLGLTEYVHFLGSISRDDLRYLAYNAVANPSFYDYSNLGNVFFEIFSTGAVIVGLDDGSLHEYINSGENGFLVRDEADAAVIILSLLNDELLRQKILNSAIRSAADVIISSDARFDREVDYIEQLVNGSK